MNRPAPDMAPLQERIGYTFRNIELLEEALTHKSYQAEHPSCRINNERMEFLGDSVLAMTVAEHLFMQQSALSESVMSKVKSYTVKAGVLYEAASELDLGAYLRVGKGEEGTGGRHKKSLLANAFESIIGAIYIDAGLDEARAFIMRSLGETLAAALSTGDYKDYKTGLQELVQEVFGSLPRYETVGTEGLDHERVFTISVYIEGRELGRASGKSKKSAQQRAARMALKSLRQGGDEKKF